MDIYGSCYRLSNTLLTRIIALCLVIADQFFKRYETSYFGESNYSCPMQIFPLIDVLSISSFNDSVSFCSGWVSDTVLASALQFFIKITFEVLTSEIVELNIIACTLYTVQTGSRLKDKTQNANTSAYVTMWGPQAPVSQDIENDQWKLKSRAWPPTPYPLPIQYPPQACLIWGVTIGAVKTKFPFQLSLCRISIFSTYKTSSVIHPTFLWH